jgi:hypothetical protein
MKRTFFITLLFVTTILSVHAQSESGNVFIAPKAGCNYSNFMKSNGSYKFGFTGGLDIEYFLSKKTALDTEIDFSRQGAHNLTYAADNSTYDYRVNLLSFNVVAKYYPVKHFNIFAGGQAARVVFCKANGLDIKDDVKHGLYGATAGMGLEMGKFTIDARYVYYINKLAKTEDTLTKAVLKDATLGGVWLTVGYKIQMF